MTLANRRGIAAPMLIGLALLATATPSADAFWFLNGSSAAPKKENWVQKGAKKNVHWPSPHLCADRNHVRAPFDLMVENGWRRQNLIGTHHFNEQATELTQSGKLKIRWILTQAPQEYRRVFVERSLEEGITEKRMTTVQQFSQLVAQGIGTGQTPPIADTHIVSEGRPAATVDFVNTQFRENMPTPALPAAATQGSQGAQ